MLKNNSLIIIIILQCIFMQSNVYSQDKKPNIIYILADDLGIGDLTIYNENGKIPTPHLDKMGTEGMRFTDAHTTSSICTPSRYSILTGRYSWRTPLKEFIVLGNAPTLIRKDRLTVAKLLQENGYQTANIGKWHLGLNWSMKNNSPEFDHITDRRGDRLDFNQIDYSKPLKFGILDLGFDYSYAISTSLNMPPYVYLENDKATQIPTKITERSRKEFPFTAWMKGAIADNFKHDQVLPTFVNKAVSYIKEKANDEKPFFLYLPLPAPHSPVLPIAPWKGKSDINEYADFVMMVDDLMGDIFKTLKCQGIEENTMIVFTSDNGCAASTANIGVLKKKNHNPSYIYSGSKGSYLEGGHRVPFLVKWPGKVQPNSVCNTTICTTDFMATVADLVNYQLKDNEAEDSYSMMPLLTQKGTYNRKATVHHDKFGIFAIRKGDWKLIVSPNSGITPGGKPHKLKTPLPEYILYNLKTDVKERNNIAKQHPDKVKELKELLAQIIKDGRSTPGKVQQNDSIRHAWPQAEFVNLK
ncbi:arylsulfatase [Tamlana sedimentorum]|uniref:Arylsulfatase n=2 Tax=Neotamlana sedimentorum TaxID=1435349 RepID=A0A0D7WB70_9FLAO|nr:arylsulfatase [Tamlana sedimentorum]